MLIPIETLSKVWRIEPNGVIHVGAHEAEELEQYKAFKWGKVIWVEAQPSLAENLRKTLDPKENIVIEAAVWNKTGEKVSLNIASNGQSTSIFEFGTHQTNYPKIKYVGKLDVVTSRLDEIIETTENFNFANFDIQGAEFQAIEGMGNLIKKVTWIYTEVNKKDVYLNCTKINELDSLLSKLGFVRINTRWVLGKGWGDALYSRREIKYSKKQKLSAIILNINWYLTPLKNAASTPKYTFKATFRHLIRKISAKTDNS